jgi:hypothetical protein
MMETSVVRSMGCTIEASYAASGGWLVTRVREWRNGALAWESIVSQKLPA